MTILFCSRGRGRGHAVRDLAIIKDIRRQRPGIAISLASYDCGAEILRGAGEFVHDLSLPEYNSFPETVVCIAEILRQTRPSLVVAQEELGALLAAKVCETDAVFTTHWFPVKRGPNTRALKYASRVLFMEESGIFEEPPEVQGQVSYCGPVLRPIRHDPTAAFNARARLGLGPEGLLVLVVPGSPPEEREPIFDLVFSAFSLLKRSPKRLLWVAGRDYVQLSDRARGIGDVEIIESTTKIDNLIVASNAVITKGTYNISREVMALGRPSISITHKYNWVDDHYAQLWKNNEVVVAAETNSFDLAAKLAAAVERTHAFLPDKTLLSSPGARCVASEILAELDKVRRPSFFRSLIKK